MQHNVMITPNGIDLLNKIFLDFKLFSSILLRKKHHRYFYIQVNQRIIGIAVINESKNIPTLIVLEIEDEFKNQKLATSLVNGICSFYKGQKQINVTPYQPEGLKWLKPVLTKIGKLYNIEII